MSLVNEQYLLAGEFATIFLLYITNIITSCSALFIGGFILYITTLFLSDSDVTLHILEKLGKSPGRALRGKVVWVTGASSGIGRGLSLKLAEYGCRLAISARSKDKLEELREQCIKIGNLDKNDVLVLDFDISDYSVHNSCFEKVLNHFGKIDILASNAGIYQEGNWELIETSVDKRIFEVNVFSLISLARIVTRHFLKEGKGHHVVTSSLAGRAPSPLNSSYCGSKFAVQGYFESLRTEYGSKGIDVTLLDIGPVSTNLFNVTINDEGKVTKSNTEWKRIMSTERCASLIAIAITHRLPEVFISTKVALLGTYYYNCFTTSMQWGMKFMDIKKLAKNLQKLNI